MDSKTAFFKTLETFHVKAAEVSEKSGVAPEVISKFKTGKQQNLRQDTFDKLVDALPDDARFYYLALRFNSENSSVAS
ncbi:hypothetical protein V2H45_05885 [Tumidithrix elongata RA019]|uniref:HTH cro/C1-type domain-containing protein n=1 Tax=Tumidithrix elongata BACA0141 TaxID=2716417 RepID=A0AAW9Q0X9_9CYAN|nr:hypothetical protein [Tumidithrix elongata RA019]